MNTGVHASLSIMVSSGYMPSCGIVGSYGSFSPSFWMNLHTVLLTGCIDLYSHQHYMRIPFSPHLLHCLLFVDFLMMVILTGVRLYLTEVLICISLIMSDVEHLFTCLLAIVCLLWRNVCLGLLAGGFLTTGPSGKAQQVEFLVFYHASNKETECFYKCTFLKRSVYFLFWLW